MRGREIDIDTHAHTHTHRERERERAYIHIHTHLLSWGTDLDLTVVLGVLVVLDDHGSLGLEGILEARHALGTGDDALDKGGVVVLAHRDAHDTGEGDAEDGEENNELSDHFRLD